jgi:hypothetical protein
MRDVSCADDDHGGDHDDQDAPGEATERETAARAAGTCVPVVVLGFPVEATWLRVPGLLRPGSSLAGMRGCLSAMRACDQTPSPLLPGEPAHTVPAAHRVVAARTGDRAPRRDLGLQVEDQLDLPLRVLQVVRFTRGDERIVRRARGHAPQIVSRHSHSFFNGIAMGSQLSATRRPERARISAEVR